ncbi:unnamed protein product [Ranitomeya imitator]|uniref:CRAL/TRIO N-terminal domain-containing protein n=1 Tax=Ranitomeya imitator TaxID=111125 RepID=A0ABN9LK59_9NEOB|nr:unnamed protein product [Ranitomeya imitator]
MNKVKLMKKMLLLRMMKKKVWEKYALVCFQAIEEFISELKNREQPQVVTVPPNTAVKFLMARKFDVLRAIDLFQAYRLQQSD